MEPKANSKIHLLPLALTLLLFSSVPITLAASATAAATTPAAASSNTYRKYLKAACNSTRYPKLCYSSLSPYSSIIKTNDLTLCTTALNVSVQLATSTSSLIQALLKQQGKLTNIETEVIQDCLHEIGDSTDELSQSLSTLRSLNFNSSDVRFQISNIKTWVSAAITDEYTCTDGFDGTKVRSSLQKKMKKLILNVSSMTSNALALINNKLNV